MIKVEIDSGSGFCFGVVNAIKKAEEELSTGETLYCLGDIVHNGREVNRLNTKGLITINHEEFSQLKNVKVLLRAHGEPPETYSSWVTGYDEKFLSFWRHNLLTSGDDLLGIDDLFKCRPSLLYPIFVNQWSGTVNDDKLLIGSEV